jgi:hypothetical protein
MATSQHHKKFCKELSYEEKMLILLRDELYSGSWERMLRDLEDRLHSRPYIFKLASRIHDDIKRIKKLRDYEQKYVINLANFL